MGVLNPVCVATDGQYVYGLAFASNYSDPSSSYNILIKSNQYPTPVANRWTLISAIPRDGYYYLGEDNFGGRQYSCVVDSNGVFTALAQNSRSSKSASDDKVVRGLQYQPAGNVWKNVNTSPNYMWPDGSVTNLMYIQDPATGASSLTHASVITTDPTKGPIAYAKMDPSTLTMVQNPTTWSLDASIVGDIKGLALMSNSTMYAFGKNSTSTLFDGVMTTITLPTGSTAQPPVTSMKSAQLFMIISSCSDFTNFNMFSFQNYVYIVCKKGGSGPPSTFVGWYNGDRFNNFQVDGNFDNVRSFLPVIGSAVPYIFMHNTTGVYGVNLQGVKVGTWQGNLNKISIPDSYGLNDSPNSPSTSPTSSESAGGGSKAGIIGGVCAALVVVVGAILFVFYRRKRRQLQKDDGKDGSPTNPTPVPTHQGGGDNLILGKINVDMASNSPMKLETVPSYQDLYPQQHPPQPTSYLTYPNSTPSTSQAPANGMYTSAGQYNPTPFNPGFSNLPATNAGYEGQPAPTFWEPKPFVPPPRNNNTSGQGSSS